MCLLLLRVCFIQDISRDLFREDLGQIILLWEYILAQIWRKTRSVLRSRSRPHFGSLLELFFQLFGAPGPPQTEPFCKPFRFMLPSRGALRLKIEDFGGVWLQSFFCSRDFASFLEGSWTVKTLISHGRGSKNHNFTEVRILSLFVSILGVILEPKSL